jgi:UDP-glucose 6-dehydrogenase
MKVALIGNGYLGQAYAEMMPEALVYDEPKRLLGDREFVHSEESFAKNLEAGRAAVNACDIAIIAVPTDPLPNGSLDMSIIEEVVDWCESDTILIKSALMPSTVDRLVEKTGKNIAVSVEYIGMGKYYVPPEKYPDPTDPSKHKVLVVGGEEPARTKAAELLWSKMSPDTRIHLVTAKEAEIVKLIENAYGALKVTFANCVYSLAENSGTNFINIHQAWSEDGRVDPMHTRVVSGKRGWKSHCYDKDIQALAYYAEQVGADDLEELFDVVVELNQEHLRRNG